MKSNLELIINEEKSFSEIIPSVIELLKEVSLKTDNFTFSLHPLGFYYCRLLETDTNQIRLHIWEKGYKQKQDLFIHDHYYDLCSWIILGKIEDINYTVTKSDQREKYSRFIASYGNDENSRQIERTDEYLKVVEIDRRIIVAGQKYFIQRDTFHSNNIIFEETEFTVTIAFAYNYKTAHEPNVIGFAENQIHKVEELINVSSENIKFIIDKIIADLYPPAPH